jgi:hypothetical protein
LTKKKETTAVTGAWRLVSFDYTGEKSGKLYPFGTQVTGILIYDESGSMAVQIVNKDRLMFASNDQGQGTPEEIKNAFETFAAYFGTYTVDSKAGTIIHHTQGSSYPNLDGKDQLRYYELTDTTLTLKTPQIEYNGEMIQGILNWERV